MDTAELPEDVKSMCNGIKSLLATGKDSDLIIKRGLKEWKVHKAVIRLRSSFFDAGAKPEWLVPHGGAIELFEESEQLIDQMIKFLYTFPYDDKASDDGPIQFNLKMLIAADKFGIQNLDKVAQGKFMQRVQEMGDYLDFLDMIPLLYEDAPAGATDMRKQVVEIAMTDYSEGLTSDCDSAKGKEIKRLIKEIPAFGAELAVALAAQVEALIQHSSKKEKEFQLWERLLNRREISVDRRNETIKEEEAAIREHWRTVNRDDRSLENRERGLRERQVDFERRSKREGNDKMSLDARRDRLREQQKALEEREESLALKTEDFTKQQKMDEGDLEARQKVFAQKQMDLEKKQKEMDERQQQLCAAVSMKCRGCQRQVFFAQESATYRRSANAYCPFCKKRVRF